MVHPIGRSEEILKRASGVIPGGVNSQNRVVPGGLVVREAHGAYLVEESGRRVLDYHAAFGPIVLGHADPGVNSAVAVALKTMDLAGVGITESEVELAEQLVARFPSAQKVLLTNSGSEATYAAIRGARAATGRTEIVKFQGAYHGWHDAVALNVISVAARIGERDLLSDGMAPGVHGHTHVLAFNDVPGLEDFFAERGSQVAAILVEIVQHNVGCMLPSKEFLEAARRIGTEYGTVLIFDEVVTGIRHSLGGYQQMAGVTPDLTIIAKALGNGYPIAALLGIDAIMERFAPGGGVFFAGTFNGHAAGVAAALATIERLDDGSVHERTARLARRLAEGLRDIARDKGIPMTVAQFGSVVTPYFYEGPVSTYTDLLANDNALDVQFRRSMCNGGVFMIPAALKRNHVSAAHTDDDITMTLEVAERVLGDLTRVHH